MSILLLYFRNGNDNENENGDNDDNDSSSSSSGSSIDDGLPLSLHHPTYSITMPIIQYNMRTD